MQSTKELKRPVRNEFKKHRDGLSLSYREDAQQNAEKIFIKHIDTDKQKIVSAYYPYNNEINPIPLLEQLNSKQVQTALPVIKEKDAPLIFHKWMVGEKLYESSFFKLQEPNSEPVIPDIIITPLLAFDANGHRLGYGGGYYDKTFRELKSQGHNFISLGYAYSFQEAWILPTSDTDISLDYIVTDEKLFKF